MITVPFLSENRLKEYQQKILVNQEPRLRARYKPFYLKLQ